MPSILALDPLLSSVAVDESLAASATSGTSAADRRALLFFLSHQDTYRRPLFSTQEIFCGPDTDPRQADGRVAALRTPVGECDLRKILEGLPSDQQPELVVVKADATGRNFPRNLDAVSGPKVLLVGDTHHLAQPIRRLVRYAQSEPFDFIVFDHTRHHARFFAEAGLRNLFWLPALDYGFTRMEPSASPSRPLTFVGQAGRHHPYRCWVLDQVAAAGLPLERLRGALARTAEIYADSQITLNISLNGDLNLRVFEALAAGGFLLTDELAAESGLSRLFRSGRHLDTWRSPGELLEKIRHYLAHPEEAQRIRRAGQAELIRHHHPAVKLREFYDLLDFGRVNPLYDLPSEPWWPRAEAAVAPGWSWRTAAYEALQELHRTARGLIVFAAEPAALADLANLPRLGIAPLGKMGTKEIGALPAEQALWWDESTPEGALANFSGDLILAATEAAADRPELAAWGFAPETAGAPVWRLVRPDLFLPRAWKAGARETVRARLTAVLASARDSIACLAPADFAARLGDRALQHSALRRAVALDRHNQVALLSLAAMAWEEKNAVSTFVSLEEAARVAPLPTAVEALRNKLYEQTQLEPEIRPYLRVIGRVPVAPAERPRRILLVTNLFPPQELGGYGRMMWEFAEGLAGRGHEVRVLAADAPGTAKIPTPDEAAMESRVFRRLQLGGEYREGRPVPAAAAEIARRYRENSAHVRAAVAEFAAEVVLVGNLDFLGTDLIQTALDAGLPVLHALANAAPGYAAAAQPRSERYWVAPCSDWNGTVLRQAGYQPARVETLYPGARLDRFFRLYLPDNSRLRLCYASLVMPYKGAQVLVRALIRLHRQGIDFTAEIAGEAPGADFLAELRDLVRASGMAEKVSFTGFLDRGGLTKLFSRSNVLVFPSLFPEPFGISQVEALAAGLVVVSSGTGGAKEIVRHGQDGLVSPAGDAEALARNLLALGQDPALMTRLQRAGQARAAEFSVSNAVRKIEQLMDGLLAGAPAIPFDGQATVPAHAPRA